MSLAATHLEPTPDFGRLIETAYLLAMAKIKGVVNARLGNDWILLGVGASAPTIRLSAEAYGQNVLKVREMLRLQPIIWPEDWRQPKAHLLLTRPSR